MAMNKGLKNIKFGVQVIKMKKIFWVAVLGMFGQAATAQKVVDKAVVKVATEITLPENQGPPGEGGGDRMMMFGGGGTMETGATIYFRPDFTRIENKSDFGTNIVIQDRKAGRTTTLMEMMGRKMGFYSDEAQEKEMQRRMDSLRSLKADSLKALGFNVTNNQPEIIYTDESKKIAGYECKKAVIKTPARGNQPASEMAVWYNTEIKMAEGFTLGGGGGGPMRMMGGGLSSLEKLKGMPMEYEMTRGNGFKMHVVVQKIDLAANIEDKLFEIPKGYDIKPMSEMMGPGGQGGMRFMFRN